MTYRMRGLSLAIVLLATTLCHAQTTVQLPTFSYFTVATTMVVPDRGGAYMGGVGRAQSGRTQYGAPLLPGNVATGSHRSAAGMQVTATIHDLEAMDKALLGGTPAAQGALPSGEVGRQLAQARQSAAGAAVASVEELKNRHALADAVQNAEARAHFETARAAETENKPGVARVHYQMALRRAVGPLREEIALRLAALQRPGARLANKPN